MTERSLHGVAGITKGRLRLDHTPLGNGLVLTGVAPSSSPDPAPPSLSPECRSLLAATARQPPHGQAFLLQTLLPPPTEVPSAYPPSHSDPTDDDLPHLPEEFSEAEDLTCAPQPLCNNCRRCQTCRFRRVHFSNEDQEVVDRVEREMKLVNGRLHVSYPWRPCVERMQPNYDEVVKIQK